LLGLWPGLWPGPGLALAPRPRPPPPDARGDLDSVINLAKALLGDTKAFLELLKSRFPAEGEHKLESLPVLAMSALELPNIQVSRLSLPRAGAAPPVSLSPPQVSPGVSPGAPPGAPPGVPGSPGAPPPQVSPWGAVRAAHALARQLHLYLDWAARALVLLRQRL
ncbi:interleukin-11, partial [Passer montanus]|uniref:interleukin-11 n=1 Tax=Passer montanus TaxID=9160 RepID=UPI001960ABB7